jgi:hypothetical protein
MVRWSANATLIGPFKGRVIRNVKSPTARWALPSRHRCVSGSACGTGLHVRPANFLTQDTIGDRVAKPLPLSLAEFLVSAGRVGVWCFALHGFPLRLARSALSGAPLAGRGRKFNSPAKAAELMHPEPRSEDAARR